MRSDDSSNAPASPPARERVKSGESPLHLLHREDANREARARHGSLTSTLAQISSLLTRGERRQLMLLFPAIVGMALLETVGIASILPFIALLANPDAITNSVVLTWAYETFAFESRDRFFFFVGLVVLFVLTFGNAFGGLTTWALLRFSWMRNHSIAMRLLEGYLRHPYAWFLSTSTTDLAQRILLEVHHVIRDVVVSTIQLAARLVSVAAILCTVLYVDPLMALFVGGVFGGLYGAFFFVVQRRLARLGSTRVTADSARFKLTSEAFAGIKEVKLAGLEDHFLLRFEGPSLALARALADSNTLAQAPRFVLESIGFGGVLLTVLLWLYQGRALETVLPVLGLYAFGAYRILPALQVVFTGLASIRGHAVSLHTLARDLRAMEVAPERSPSSTPLPFERFVALKGATFVHERAAHATIHDVNLHIDVGSWLAIVGPTGSGKSTLVDLLLGLLTPSTGALLVDGGVVDAPDARRWQKNAGYVPQQSFLADDTIARNIAFGFDAHEIDVARLVEAARIAQIHDFIESELPKGYETEIGERGVRLSGGQRQRLGIARALYRRPRFLVLDEATSALDHDTEARFFTALRAALTGVTVVSIAHRLTTTRDFDRVIVVDAGRIVDEGTFAELASRHPHFRSLSQGERDQASRE
jgi:ABC-type multidrug transport system fused ATPase/permease subunit